MKYETYSTLVFTKRMVEEALELMETEGEAKKHVAMRKRGREMLDHVPYWISRAMQEKPKVASSLREEDREWLAEYAS